MAAQNIHESSNVIIIRLVGIIDFSSFAIFLCFSHVIVLFPFQHVFLNKAIEKGAVDGRDADESDDFQMILRYFSD